TPTSHAMPTEIRMTVMMVGAAAGSTTLNALRIGDTSSVRATLSHSRRTADTPNAVLISMGHSEQMKITNIDEVALSLIVYSASGIHASGEIGFNTWINGSNARYSSGDMPIRKPRGIATSAASPKP